MEENMYIIQKEEEIVQTYKRCTHDDTRNIKTQVIQVFNSNGQSFRDIRIVQPLIRFHLTPHSPSSLPSHPSSPSRLLDGTTLTQYLADHPSLIGDEIMTSFHAEEGNVWVEGQVVCHEGAVLTHRVDGQSARCTILRI